MRQSIRYGRIKERTFKFTRHDVETLIRAHVRNVATVIAPLPTERVDVVVTMDTDGIDLEGHELFVLTETFVDLRDEPQTIDAVPGTPRDSSD